MSYGISREQEHALPQFNSHDEARAYFKDLYGSDFQMTDSSTVNGEKIYFYKLILNKSVYNEMIKEIEANGYCAMNEERIFCTQDIQIFESGHIHIVH